MTRLTVQEMTKGNTSRQMGREPKEAGNNQTVMQRGVTIFPLVKERGKEGMEGGILVRWKHLRPPCSSNKAQRN